MANSFSGGPYRGNIDAFPAKGEDGLAPAGALREKNSSYRLLRAAGFAALFSRAGAARRRSPALAQIGRAVRDYRRQPDEARLREVLELIDTLEAGRDGRPAN